ncbi:MAG: nucleotidyltransferase family protein [Candidatus Aquicultor sp.]
MVDAIILAGGSAKGLAEVPAKGLVPVNGRPMFEYVVDALSRCQDIDRICVVLPVEHSLNGVAAKADVITATGSLPGVAKAGIDFLGAKSQVLILSTDIPLISPEAISDFLGRCSKRKADIYYPIVKYGESEKRFPEVKRTYVKVKEGRFTGGNLVLVEPEFVNKNVALIERMYELRKKPVKLAQVLGIMFLFRFVLGLLSIGQVEQRVGRLTRSTCMAIITPFIEIGVDVDKESDLQLATVALGGGTNE